MRAWTVLGDRAGGPLGPPQTRVAGHSTTAVEDLDDGVGHAQLDLFADESVRHAVQTGFVLDVVVDVDLGPLPPRELPARLWQRAQGRAIQRLEGRLAAAL